jgi:hypothetical protein
MKQEWGRLGMLRNYSGLLSENNASHGD